MADSTPGRARPHPYSPPATAASRNLELLLDFEASEAVERLAPATRLGRMAKLVSFCQWLGDRSLLDTSSGEVAFFVDSRGDVAASTRTAYFGALHAFYAWACAADLTDVDPAWAFLRSHRRVDRGPFHELAHDWRIAQERRAIAQSTIEVRRAQLRRFSDFLEPRSVLDATTGDVERWLDGMCELGPRARYNYLSHLHAFYKWAIKAGRCDTDPTADIDRPKLPRLVPRPISDQDLADALTAAPARVAAWLALAAYQGMRCKEIASLCREDILDHLTPPVVIIRGKGNKERIVPLHPVAFEIVRRGGLPRSGHLFRKAGGRPVSAYTVSTNGSRFLHDIGSPATMHQLRHWFGTHVYNHSRDIRMTQELLGHSSPTTTAMYVAFNPGDAVAAVAGLAVAGASQ